MITRGYIKRFSTEFDFIETLVSPYTPAQDQFSGGKYTNKMLKNDQNLGYENLKILKIIKNDPK